MENFIVSQVPTVSTLTSSNKAERQAIAAKLKYSKGKWFPVQLAEDKSLRFAASSFNIKYIALVVYKKK